MAAVPLRSLPPVIAVLLVPSPVEPGGRAARLSAASGSWGKALRRVPSMRLRVLLSAASGAKGKAVSEEDVKHEAAAIVAGAEEAGGGTAAASAEREALREVLPRAVVGADNAERLLGALRAIYDEGAHDEGGGSSGEGVQAAAWVFAANDHTFLVPENLRSACLLYAVFFCGRGSSPSRDLHRLSAPSSFPVKEKRY